MKEELFKSLSPDLQDAYIQYCLPDDLSKLTIDSVILSAENKEKIDAFLVETEYKDKFIRYGLEPVNRILSYGASGTGKTFLTKCLAAHFGYELLSLDINSAISTGAAAHAIESIFKLGNHLGKCIIFLDECDVIARDRTDKSVPVKPETREAINGIFQLLDRMNSDCIFIAATNLYDELDPAFVRRFNVKLKFDRPIIDKLDDVINKFIHPAFTINNDMEIEIKDIILEYARNYTELSYDEIETWVERAEKQAIIKGSEIIEETEIYKFFMESLRIRVYTNEDDNSLYLYQIS